MIYGNWEVIGPPLGSGGQGTVYKGRDVRRFDRNAELDKVTRTVSQLSSIATAEDRRKSAEQLLQSLDSLRSMDTPENLGAVKVLHRGNDPSEYKKAVERMNNEI